MGYRSKIQTNLLRSLALLAGGHSFSGRMTSMGAAGAPLPQVLDSATTDSDGMAAFSPIIPSSVAPGFYDIRIHAPDDISDNLSAENAGRWIGNHTQDNLTLQELTLIHN